MQHAEIMKNPSKIIFETLTREIWLRIYRRKWGGGVILKRILKK